MTRWLSERAQGVTVDLEWAQQLGSWAWDLGPWATAITAICVALRTHATSSAGTIRQLQVWLAESRDLIETMRKRITTLEQNLARLAGEVERLTPFEQRSKSLAAELRELRRALGADGGAQDRAPREPDEGGAEVVHLWPRDGGG